ncbi:adenosine deaminase [Granulicella sp. dw_53]|uniref:adenosine deaminase family protein n=1 Tax=Granulicella sp. dw_53 TaxID=2719792 RepID=UPI001BD618EA|nr:adenosine deaminase [Granulicella sp. dw_53]
MRRLSHAVLLLCLTVVFANAQVAVTPQEARAVRAFNVAKTAGPFPLHAFLANMPKGADLHMHLSGAVYAESFIAEATVDHLCVNQATLSFIKAESMTRSSSPQPVCGDGNVPAASAFKDQKLYDALVNSFSMRSFVATPGTSGHDQFFATFARFGSIDKSHVPEWLDEVATRSAAQNGQYLEIMQTPSFGAAAKLGYQLGWPEGPKATGNSIATPRDATRAELAHLRDQLLAASDFRTNITEAAKELDDALAARTRLEHCGEANAVAACSVQIRFIGQVLRAFPPQQVFAQTLLYFELASIDPNVVGINFVQPEDAYMSMSEYHRQMLMLDYLHAAYPKVHISLHAGELAPGLVPPDGLSFHIREAVDLGHAERIGHGVDVMYEKDPTALLKELADRHIMVEINLTSNDGILGISGKNHPLPNYRAAHVPVALSTDDEGVSRGNITQEYTRAALEFNLTYTDLKNMARTSVEHSFLAGPSLWSKQDTFNRSVEDCATQPLGADTPNAKCTAFLKSSDKAAQQWELEHRFKVFESSL